MGVLVIQQEEQESLLEDDSETIYRNNDINFGEINLGIIQKLQSSTFTLDINDFKSARAYARAILDAAKNNTYLHDLLEEIIVLNDGLVSHVANKFRLIPSLDNFSLLKEELLYAAVLFDTSRGNCFSTYASKFLENKALKLLKSEKISRSDTSVLLNHNIGIVVTLLSRPTEDTAFVNIKIEELNRVLEKALTPRQYEVVCLHFGLNDLRASNYEQMTSLIGGTSKSLGTIQVNALKRLREFLNQSENFELADFLNSLE